MNSVIEGCGLVYVTHLLHRATASCAMFGHAGHHTGLHILHCLSEAVDAGIQRAAVCFRCLEMLQSTTDVPQRRPEVSYFAGARNTVCGLWLWPTNLQSVPKEGEWLPEQEAGSVPQTLLQRDYYKRYKRVSICCICANAVSIGSFGP